MADNHNIRLLHVLTSHISNQIITNHLKSLLAIIDAKELNGLLLQLGVLIKLVSNKLVELAKFLS